MYLNIFTWVLDKTKILIKLYVSFSLANIINIYKHNKQIK